jgi:ribonucleoside-triphosphate reductase (thioredoxin)
MFITKLDPSFLTPFKTAKPNWGPTGFVAYKRTYSRKLDPSCTCPGIGCTAAEHRVEDWHETILRGVNAILERGAFTKEEAETLYTFWFWLKCSGGGRFLWQLGTQTVEKVGADSLQNCWFVACRELRAFLFAMDQLMLGGGVGFSVQAEHIYKLPPVKFNPEVRRVETYDCDFIVPDNREGWVLLLDQVFQSFFVHGKRLTFNVRCLREKGKPIKTFGGTASGGEILVEGIMLIVKVLKGAVGRQLSSVECLDVFNIIGHIVVAGNVRRSAEIAIGDHFDARFIEAKQWQKVKVPNWRARSNNSIACSSIRELPEEFWGNYNGEGEPVGLINLSTMRRYGRLVDGLGYRDDPDVQGTNPCGEISLGSYESCNLSEIFLPNNTRHDFFVSAELMTKVCKTISCIPHSQPETRAVVEKNHRLGVGVTGFLQALDLHDERLFDAVYKHVEETDRKYSKLLGVDPSIKLTTVKPSGTLSLLPGVTPGVHAAFGHYYIRRIEFASDDKLVEVCKKNGYHVEPKLNFDGTRDLKSMVVEFPCKTPVGTVVQDELSAVEQLEHQLWLQKHWSDNSVSCTVQYWPEELAAIRKWLDQHYDEEVKTVSFLLRANHGFKQMPYEEIEEEEYLEIASKVKPIDDGVDTFGDMSSQECTSGVCPVR